MEYRKSITCPCRESNTVAIPTELTHSLREESQLETNLNEQQTLKILSATSVMRQKFLVCLTSMYTAQDSIHLLRCLYHLSASTAIIQLVPYRSRSPSSVMICNYAKHPSAICNPYHSDEFISTDNVTWCSCVVTESVENYVTNGNWK